MEVVQERLFREYNVNIITTVPNVKYKVRQTNGDEMFIESPAKLPAAQYVESVSEPIDKVQIITPTEFTGAIMKLCEDKRGEMGNMEYLESTRVCLHYRIPLSEIIIDFFDKLKSYSKGYASMDYEFDCYQQDDLIKMDILINGMPVDAFSAIIHREKSYSYGQEITSKLKELIPRQQYDGGDPGGNRDQDHCTDHGKSISQRRHFKVLRGRHNPEAQAPGKTKRRQKRMKQVGNVEIPQEAFLAVLSRE